MSPEGMIFTFKQGSDESFKEPWGRINNYYDNTEPKMTLSLLLINFHFGLVLRYRYALDTVVGGDFLICDGDQAFNGVKKVIATYSSPSDYDSSLASICARLNTLETSTTSLKEYCFILRESFSITSEPSSWFPTMNVAIDNKILPACCDIMSEFCLMPNDIYDSLNLWEYSKGEEEVILADNTILLPLWKAEGVHTIFLGRTISTNYSVIKCAGKGQITLGRALLESLGARIDVGKGSITFSAPPRGSHWFPRKKKSKSNKGKLRASNGVDAPPLDNT
jgi:hypothetical protein